MAGNSFGELFRINSFGESHGTGIGVVIDGCPAGLAIDTEFIQKQLDRRKPGQSHITTQRKEEDQLEILSGVYEGKSTGAPLTLFIKNKDQRPADYSHLETAYRPSHADFTYQQKYAIRDVRGGGRSSARETAARVMAGAIAQLILQHRGITIQAYVSQVGLIKVNADYTQLDLNSSEENIIRCPDEKIAGEMIHLIEEIKKAGDTIGGVVSCVINHVPIGLGEPVFDKLQADLAKAMLSINAAKGFDFGSGFDSLGMKGSEHNDLFESKIDLKGHPVFNTKTNHSGGIQGGISNGETIYFRVAFKPVSTIMQTQESVDKDGNKISLEAKGRHDPCVVPRAVPIVEAMAALVLVDHYLRNKTAKL